MLKTDRAPAACLSPLLLLPPRLGCCVSVSVSGFCVWVVGVWFARALLGLTVWFYGVCGSPLSVYLGGRSFVSCLYSSVFVV